MIRYQTIILSSLLSLLLCCCGIDEAIGTINGFSDNSVTKKFKNFTVEINNIPLLDMDVPSDTFLTEALKKASVGTSELKILWKKGANEGDSTAYVEINVLKEPESPLKGNNSIDINEFIKPSTVDIPETEIPNLPDIPGFPEGTKKELELEFSIPSASEGYTLEKLVASAKIDLDEIRLPPNVTIASIGIDALKDEDGNSYQQEISTTSINTGKYKFWNFTPGDNNTQTIDVKLILNVSTGEGGSTGGTVAFDFSQYDSVALSKTGGGFTQEIEKEIDGVAGLPSGITLRKPIIAFVTATQNLVVDYSIDASLKWKSKPKNIDKFSEGASSWKTTSKGKTINWRKDSIVIAELTAEENDVLVINSKFTVEPRLVVQKGFDADSAFQLRSVLVTAPLDIDIPDGITVISDTVKFNGKEFEEYYVGDASLYLEASNPLPISLRITKLGFYNDDGDEVHSLLPPGKDNITLLPNEEKGDKVDPVELKLNEVPKEKRASIRSFQYAVVAYMNGQIVKKSNEKVKLKIRGSVRANVDAILEKELNQQ